MLDYMGKFKQTLSRNIELVRDQIDSPAMVTKINNWANKYSLSPDRVRMLILSDYMFAVQFAKDPSKQNVFETWAAEYIESIYGVEDFENLPNGGIHALSIISGMIVPHKSAKKSSSTVKTIDFKWTYNDKMYYASHKYIRGAGGAQDNQHNDIIKFMDSASMSNESNVVFVAICDGSFYENNKKIKDLNRLHGRRNKVVALGINELKKFMERN